MARRLEEALPAVADLATTHAEEWTPTRSARRGSSRAAAARPPWCRGREPHGGLGHEALAMARAAHLMPPATDLERPRAGGARLDRTLLAD